ncbi:hypothetical protein KAI58_02545 [Candidatus Gracilibacteria bacterium]|nr:hypothetical protein [Candidatus Gracilibacteria bacterium]
MSFEDLEAKLKKFFLSTEKTSKDSIKQDIRQKTLEVFRRQRSFRIQKTWNVWHKKLSLSFSLLLMVSVLVSLNYPFSNNEIIAGKIKTLIGPVEIIRGTESFLVKDSSEILVGDFIKIGNNGEAKLVLPNQFISVAKNQTHFRVTDKNAIFLERGILENNVFRGAEIATNRGFILSPNGAIFNVSVSETGETKVSPQKNLVNVFDLMDGQISLEEGDEIILRSDTRLTQKELPSDLRLSNSQLASIYAKLVIARTKLLTGVERLLFSNEETARKDFSSAEKTFLSIAQVLKTSRELEISRRKNLNNLNINEILPKIAKKTNDEKLLTEIKALETLFTILKQNRGSIAFAPQSSGVESFDRYVTLKNLFSIGTEEQQIMRDVLLQKYVINFLRKVQNEELRIDQVSILNAEIEKMPKNEVSREFLEQVRKLFAPDLAEFLTEKIEYAF